MRISSGRIVRFIMDAQWLFQPVLDFLRVPSLNMSIMTGYGIDPSLIDEARRYTDVYYLIHTGDGPHDTPDDLCVPRDGEFLQPLDGWAYEVPEAGASRESA